MFVQTCAGKAADGPPTYRVYMLGYLLGSEFIGGIFNDPMFLNYVAIAFTFIVLTSAVCEKGNRTLFRVSFCSYFCV